MRAALPFIYQLAVASLHVPMLTFFSADLAYWLARYIGASTTGPQQFYSDHLLLLAGITGVVVGYVVCESVGSTSGLWVCIPALFVLGLRVAIWRSGGSVLFHGSVIDHFVTADCQIQSWHDVGFSTRCDDKTLLMPLMLGCFGYSLGAAIQVFKAQKLRSRLRPTQL